jgi:glycosyltransferase involved in cell wall biosynthesis
MTNNRFHLWFPDIFEFKGGIQTYSAFLLTAIQKLYPKNSYRVFLKHDRYPSPNFCTSAPTQFHCTGIVPLPMRTAAFAAQIIEWGFWERPNLVIASHLNFAVAAYLLKCLAGIPYWVTVYGLEAWDLDSPVLKKVLNNADRIVSISAYTRDRLIKKQNLDPAKFSLLPCTFDASNFKVAPKPSYLLEKYGLKPGQPVILTVARLINTEGYKGYDRILRAIPQIRQIIPDVHYIIVGKGNDRARIEQLMTQLELQDCVTLAGFIPDEQICDYYNLCDVFAMPSKGEGFGIVYLEALACGKPVLAGNQDGAIDALCYGELGALVNPDDIEVIAKTLIKILQSTYPNALMYQPKALRQKVIDTFGFEHFQATLASYLKEHLLSIKTANF